MRPSIRPVTSCRCGNVTPADEWRRRDAAAADSRASAGGRTGRSTTPCGSSAPRATGPGLAFGSGSRGALALVRGGRAAALLDSRGYVTPDDVKRVALPALRHRVALAPDALLDGRKPNDVLTEIIEVGGRAARLVDAAAFQVRPGRRGSRASPWPACRRPGAARIRRCPRELQRRVTPSTCRGPSPGRLCVGATVADAILSRRAWQRPPPRLTRRLPSGVAIGVRKDVDAVARVSAPPMAVPASTITWMPTLLTTGLPLAVTLPPDAIVGRRLLHVVPLRRGPVSFAPAHLRVMSRLGTLRAARTRRPDRHAPRLSGLRADCALRVAGRRPPPAGNRHQDLSAARRRHRLQAALRLSPRRSGPSHRLEGDAAAATSR